MVFHALPHLGAREVGSVLERAVRRIERFLKKRGLLRDGENDAHEDADPDAEPTVAQGHAALCTSAASGTSPPAGPEFRRKATPLGPLAGKALSFEKPFCASLDHFTLHAPRSTRRRPRAAWTRERARRSSSTCCARRSRKSGSPPGRTAWSGSRSSARLRMARWRSTWILCRCSLGWRPRSRRRGRIRCVTPGFSPAPASCARAWCLRRPRRRLGLTSKRASLTNLVVAIGPGPSFSPRWASMLSRARSAPAACACSGSCVRRTTFERASPPWARPPSPPSELQRRGLLHTPRVVVGDAEHGTWRLLCVNRQRMRSSSSR